MMMTMLMMIGVRMMMRMIIVDDNCERTKSLPDDKYYNDEGNNDITIVMVMTMSMTMTKVIMVTNKRAKSLSNHVAFLEFQLLELLKHLL